MTKAVFFDLYQTLIKYQPTQEELESQALQKLNITASPDALRRPILAANEFLYDRMAERPLSKRTREEVAALYLEYQRVVLREAGIKAEEKVILNLLGMMQQTKMGLALFDDVLPVLQELKKRRLTVGLISNIEQNMTAALDKLGLSPHLDIVVTSQDAGFAKPDKAIFEFAIKKAGVKAGDSTYIGDQYNVDVIGSRNAGMKSILLDRYDYYRQPVDGPKIKSLSDLPVLL
jgi:putative hydrolase of the HAD superfamily